MMIFLDFNCQYEIRINPDEKITFVQYAISARGGNIMAQYKLGYCYQYGKGINKNEKKTFEWYLKSAEAGNDIAQNNFINMVKEQTRMKERPLNGI